LKNLLTVCKASPVFLQPPNSVAGDDGRRHIGPASGILCRMESGLKSPGPGTWAGKLIALASMVTNDPCSVRDCWYVNSTETYHTFKVGKRATGDCQVNWRTHRVLYKLLNPTYHLEYDTGLQMLHRCGNGRVHTSRGARVCINPYCVYPGTSAANADTKGCVYGALFLCPHQPSCRFNDPDTGHPIPCRNKHAGDLTPCPHAPSCFPCPKRSNL